MATDTGPLWKPPKREKKPRKPMKHKGKRTVEYEHWRDTVAIPYLDSKGPRVCARGCGATWPLDVGHKKSRGSRPDLKMDLSNVEWQCVPFNRFGAPM